MTLNFKSSVISIHSQMREYPGSLEMTCLGIMFCIYCDKSVDWKHKSTIDSHINGIKHETNKKQYEAKQQISH